MSYRSLARTWRPQTFAEVIGQEPIVRTLTHAIQGGRPAQAYLFSGQRGVGKTSLARILAKALNCETGPTPTPCGRCTGCREIAEGASLDVLEIDAASHSKVEEMRELLERVRYLSLGGRYKVYIIDEVHRLSPQAFDALLKTLEEPPPQTCFILATTELQKVPDTIFSRCQHFAFSRLAPRLLRARLDEIAKAEGVQLTERGVLALAKAADGSLRDALNLLEQAVAFCGPAIPDDQLMQVLGAADPAWLRALTTAVLRREPHDVLRLAREALDRGDEPQALVAGLLEEVSALTVLKVAAAPADYLALSKDDLESLTVLAREVSVEDLHRLFTLLTQTQDRLKTALHPGLLTEMALLKAAHLATLQPIERLLNRLLALETRLPSSSSQPSPMSSQPSPMSGEGRVRGSPAEGTGRPALTPPPTDPSPAVQQSRQPTRAVAPPAVHSPQPAPLAPPEPSSLEAVWPQVIARTKERKPLLGTHLEAGSPTAGAADEVIINFGPEGDHHIGLVEREENLAFLHEVIGQCLGRPVRLRLVATGALTKAALVQETVKIFEGRVVEPTTHPRPGGPDDATPRF